MNERGTKKKEALRRCLKGETMSNSEQTDDTSERLSVRVKKYRNRLDEIINPNNLAELLYLDRNLSRAAQAVAEKRSNAQWYVKIAIDAATNPRWSNLDGIRNEN